ncbi:hypothetical protein IT570_09625 [Candidatus Sumerlaeota bacterium]|nr:hypothetical protein [Candidatus Sumerlaeota bacterium]
MRRLDPRLAAEDTNCLFEAFRRKREVYSSRRCSLKVNLPLMIAVDLIFVVLTGLLAIFYGGKAIVMMLFLALIGAVIWLLFSMIFGVGGPASVFVPSLALGLFGERVTASKQVLFDLYLAGITGRDIVEAMYLEQRRGTLVNVVVTVLMAIGFQGLIYLLASVVDSKNFSVPITSFFVLLAGWQAYEFFFVAARSLKIQALMIPRTRADRQALFLKFESLGGRMGRDVGRLLGGAVLGAIIFVGCGLVIGLLLAVFTEAYDFAKANRTSSPLLSYLAVHAPVFSYFLAMIIVLTCLHLFRPFLDQRLEAKFQRQFDDAAERFDAILRAHACQDEETGAFGWSIYLQRKAYREQYGVVAPRSMPELAPGGVPVPPPSQIPPAGLP